MPVAVSPSKSKRKTKTKPSAHQPNEDEQPAWEEFLGAYAEIDTDGALRIDSGESAKLRAMALALLRIDPRKAVLRLRYLARGRGDSADYRREKGITGSPILRPSSTWCADIDEHAARWSKRSPETSRAETDSRWRDPGWVPTRLAAQTTQPGPNKPVESITDRALTTLELARQMKENRHGPAHHDGDDRRDVRTLEGSGHAPPRGVAGSVR